MIQHMLVRSSTVLEHIQHVVVFQHGAESDNNGPLCTASGMQSTVLIKKCLTQQRVYQHSNQLMHGAEQIQHRAGNVQAPC